MIVFPKTNLSQSRTAGAICCEMLSLLHKRKVKKIKRSVFLATWSRLRRELEQTTEYQEFRQTVLERDAYHCRSCGRIAHTVHHRRHVARAVHLVLEPDNGEVRCEECHRDEHPHMKRRSA